MTGAGAQTGGGGITARVRATHTAALGLTSVAGVAGAGRISVHRLGTLSRRSPPAPALLTPAPPA